MKITLELPDYLAQTGSFNESEWLREFAIALFQQERISLGRASKIAGLQTIEFQKLIASRGICVHYDLEEFEEDVEQLQARGWL